MSEQDQIKLLHWLISKELLDIPAISPEFATATNVGMEMQNIDWEYAFYDPLQDHIEAETEQEHLLFASIENIVRHLQRLEAAGGGDLIAAQLLQIKYWFSTDMEIQISIPAPETLEYVSADLSIQFLKKLYQRLKSNEMKEEVLDYLSNEIKYGGFDENLIPQLREALQIGQDNFQLWQQSIIGKDLVNATLNFAKSEKNGLHYLNSFTLKIWPGGEEANEIIQHVLRTREAKFTLKQGYNIAMDRAVGFVHINDQKQVTETWAMVDRKFMNADSSPQIKILPASYRYSVDDALKRYAILELKDEDEKTALINSIRRGNLTSATAERSDGIHVKVSITANPLGRSIHIYDSASGQKLNRNDFLVQGRGQERDRTSEPRVSESPGEMEAPDLPDAAKKLKHRRN